MATDSAPLDGDGNQRLKIVIAGDGACGKTVLLCAYIGKKVEENYIPTVLDTYSTTIDIKDKETAIEIMDTAGQEDLDKIRTLAYPGSHCVILCYSCVAEQTINNVKNFWDPELKSTIPKVPLVLCGNKLDLKEEKPALYIPLERANDVTKGIKRIHESMQCSALDELNETGKNEGLVNQVFQHAILAALVFRSSGGAGGCGCSLL